MSVSIRAQAVMNNDARRIVEVCANVDPRDLSYSI